MKGTNLEEVYKNTHYFVLINENFLYLLLV